MNKYPNYIMEAVRQNLGLEKDDISKDEYINNMEESEILEKYLTWNGIIGYGNMIIELIQDIYNIELKDGD